MRRGTCKHRSRGGGGCRGRPSHRGLQLPAALVLCFTPLWSPLPLASADTPINPLQAPVLTALGTAFSSSPGSACSELWSSSCSGRKLCSSDGYITTLNLRGCGYASIPAEISGLSTLTALYADNNALSALPSELSALSNLVALTLSNNQLTALPNVLQLPKLSVLKLSRNQLSGALPASLSLSDALNELDLSFNQLAGPVPQWLLSGASLATLNLQGNSFTGTFPSPAKQLPLLNLILTNNRLSSLGGLNFPALQNLYAGGNLLTSPPALGPSLTNVYLNDNQIAGQLPRSYSSLTRIYTLHLGDNQLTGAVPDWLWSLPALGSLNISGNFFSGTAPDAYCNLNANPDISFNCLSYPASLACATAQPQRDAATCRVQCGPSCVPVLPGVPLTNAPLGGCLQCSQQQVAYIYDAASGLVSYQGSNTSLNSRGSPSRNIQKYLSVGAPSGGSSGTSGSILGTSQAKGWAQCCQDCAKTSGCSFWHFYDSSADAAAQGGQAGIQCYLLGVAPPQALLPAVQAVDTTTPVSQVGGTCNPAAEVVDDPHFVGAHGTRFDFSGELNRPFCLLSDQHLHINVLLSGYLDVRTEAASKLLKGKAVRSWIKEVVILWRTREGKVLTIQLATRPGTVSNSEKAAALFLHHMAIDGIRVSLPTVGNVSHPHTGVALDFKAVARRGPSPSAPKEAVYELRLGQSMGPNTVLGIRLRPAHRKLQTSSNSHVHFNLRLLRVATTAEVHGILGQTFREDGDRVRRARLFSDVSRMIRAPVAADGESGRGFLDGTPGDYATSRPDAPDCRFSHPAWRT